MFNFLKIEPELSIYVENKTSPTMDPWGTSHMRGAEEETGSPSLTEKLLSDR